MRLFTRRSDPRRRGSTWLVMCVLLAAASGTACTFALASAPARPAAPPPLTREQADLQGVWTLETMEVDGRKAVAEQTRGWILVIRGDQYNPGSGQTSVEYTFKLDPTLNPKSIDLVPHDGPYRGRTIRGIYAYKNDRLTLCRARTPDGERPAGFATRPDSGLVATVWKRRKP